MMNKLYVCNHGGVLGYQWSYKEPVENPVVAIEDSEISGWATFTYKDGTQQAVRFDCDGRIIKLEEEDK